MDLKRLPKTEFAAAVAQIAGERNIDIASILESIEAGLISAYKRDQKDKGIEVPEENEFTVELSPESGSFKVFLVEGDKKTDVTPPGFGRIAAQTAKQVIDQKIREAEKETILADYQDKIGSLVAGIVLRIDPYKMSVGIGKTEAICPTDEQIQSEKLVLGDKRLFLIKDINQSDTGRKDIILSRRDPLFIKQLFVREVPEVSNDSVVIEKIARTAGVRTKVAVSSAQPGIDPVGSCIGQKGSRIQSVLGELPEQEKVDVIAYSDDTKQFLIQALSPATDIVLESVDNDKKIAQVTVPEDQLALAIGAGGENVHLAGRLLGLDIKISGRQVDDKTKSKPKAKSKSDDDNA